MARFLIDGAPLEFVAGDTVADALLRAGQHPARGGTLCLAGDCGNCVGVVDGTAWVRTCQTPARPGMQVRRHPLGANPSLFDVESDTDVAMRREHIDLVVVGGGPTGSLAGEEAAAAGRDVVVLDASLGEEVVAIFAGPLVVVRTPDGMLNLHAEEVIVATGAAELHPVCDGNLLAGILTPNAFARLRERGVDLGRVVAVGPTAPDAVPGRLIRFEGDAGRVTSVVVEEDGGHQRAYECDTVVVGLGTSPRDVLTRSSTDPAVRAVGRAALLHDLPPCPTSGTVCPCSKTTVEDLDGVWERGFREVELVKRSALAGTGTCQGAVCLPHVRAYVTERSGLPAQPFTARPAARQLTMGEATAGLHLDAWRRTALHHEHLALGADMDRFGGWWRPWNYGDHVAEYWAVREAVSIGDVSTLGKMIVTGPDSVELLERLYPTTVADIRPGRSRYVLLLNERGHLIDDGMIVREAETRFVLSFTSGGATNAEMWVRDWAETWGLDVRIMDRTMALGAINVTGPLGAELLRRVGVAAEAVPKFLQHAHLEVAGVACHVMRLSFTGEASWELHHPVSHSVALWRALMAAGRDLGIKPHGLQALFGLRLEKGHVIVGMDTEMDTTPRRIDHDWAVKMGKPFFLGQEALARTAPLPDRRKLLAWTMDGPAPTEGAPIWVDGEVHGHVTTSFTSPLLGTAVMLGWLKQGVFPETVTIDGRPARRAETPFYDPSGARARA
jgi:glycine cleavage system aminomethyltransferase T